MTRHQWSYTTITILLLFVCLIAINVVAYFLPIRLDMTEDRLFTIAEGTRKIVENIEDPVTIKYYFSKSTEDLPPQYKAYGQRVEEILQEYALLSKGKIKLESFDPKPDTEEEEWAQKYGIGQVGLPNGNTFYFGMVALMLDQEMAIPFFDSRRQEFLEYDISQALLKVSNTQAPKIGILTGINVMGAPSQFGQPASEWVLVSELKKNFEVESIETTTEEIPDDVTLLIVMHPKNLSDRTVYAIDQYVLRGNRLIVLVDPNSREAAQNDPMAQFGRPPDPQSNLPKLLKNWGVEFDTSKLVGDFAYATPINAGQGGVIRYPLWMSMGEDALDRDHPITSELEMLLLIEAGYLKKAEGSSFDFTPVLKTSADSGEVDAFSIRFSPPDKILRDLKPDQTERTLAALVQGTFKTAFPSGQPAKEQQEGDDPNAEPEPDTPLKHSHLNEATASNNILVIADVDLASDSYSVQKMNFLGQTIVQPINDNLNFMLNSVEFLSGNDALMSIRSRGRFSRPFTRLIALEQAAQLRFQEEEIELQKKLEDVRQKLRDLEASKDGSQQILLSPEQQEEIKKFRDEELKTRKELREVRKNLRQDIETLGNQLLAINLLAIPLLVGVAGIVVYGRRTRRRKTG